MRVSIPFPNEAPRGRSIAAHRRWSMLLSIVVSGLLAWGMLGMCGVSSITVRGSSPVLPLADPVANGDDWPGWRGGIRQGDAPSANPPVQWQLPVQAADAGKNAITSPPCVIHNAILFLMQDGLRGNAWLMCLDRITGERRWQQALGRQDYGEQALPTPASDGTRVFVATAQQSDLTVMAFDLSGQRLWSQAAGPMSRGCGSAQSPIVAGSLVYVAVDQKAPPWQWNGLGGFVAALHRQTGQIVWRTPRPSGESWSTPVVAHVAAQRQLVLPGRSDIRSYHAETGVELWKVRWSSRIAGAGVACDDASVYITGSGPERETLCVRADGNGDVEDTHVRWRARFAGSAMAPVLHEGNLIVASDDGGVTALDRQQGRVAWQQRLSGRLSQGPLLAGSRLYCFDEAGGATVLDVRQQGQIVSYNRGEKLQGVAVSGDRLVFTSRTGVAIVSGDGPTKLTYGDITDDVRR